MQESVTYRDSNGNTTPRPVPSIPELSAYSIEDLVTELINRKGVSAVVAYCDMRGNNGEDPYNWGLFTSGAMPVRMALIKMVEMHLRKSFSVMSLNE